MNIIYEDVHIIICKKPAGLAVQNASFGRKDLESMVRTHLAETGGKANPYLGIVHRLDQPVQGLVVFAKTPKAAADLSRQVQNGTMKKEYLAVVCGRMPRMDGTLEHYLKRDAKKNTSAVVSKDTSGAKKAVLDYQVIKEEGGRQLVKIRLHTGRHHQIRVQLAAAGVPLYGDHKYNPNSDGQDGLALCANHLMLIHPGNGKMMEFFCEPAEGFLIN